MNRPATNLRATAKTAAAVPEARREYEKGRLRIDFDAYEVFVDDVEVHVYLREFELLRFFVQFPNRVFSRDQLLESVWGHSTSTDPRTVDVHVRRLRMHIERDDSNPEVILTVRGVGYKFVDRGLTDDFHPPARRPAAKKRVTRL